MSFMEAYTDFPFPEFDKIRDRPMPRTAPVRLVRIESCDGKRCDVDYGGVKIAIPRDRLYTQRGTKGNVPNIPARRLNRFKRR